MHVTRMGNVPRTSRIGVSAYACMKGGGRELGIVGTNVGGL